MWERFVFHDNSNLGSEIYKGMFNNSIKQNENSHQIIWKQILLAFEH